jgi:hypothetical protein
MTKKPKMPHPPNSLAPDGFHVSQRVRIEKPRIKSHGWSGEVRKVDARGGVLVEFPAILSIGARWYVPRSVAPQSNPRP